MADEPEIPTCYRCGRQFKSNAGLESHLKKYMREGLITRADIVAQMPRCKVEGCGCQHASNGYCMYHDLQVKRYGKVLDNDRPLRGKYREEVYARHGIVTPEREPKRDRMIRFAMLVGQLADKHGFNMPEPSYVRQAFDQELTLYELEKRFRWFRKMAPYKAHAEKLLGRPLEYGVDE